MKTLAVIGAYLRLLRPANIVTAFADILLGFAASGLVVNFPDPDHHFLGIDHLNKLLWLLLSTFGLYGGGVVFNDYFDADTDKKERPERPIPSGYATKTGAALLGLFLFVTGIASAAMVGFLSAFVATIVSILALNYDYFTKHNVILGPLNMGLCRGGNLLLGLSSVPLVFYDLWYIAFFPVIYIAAITTISRAEVHGGGRGNMVIAAFMYAFVILSILAYGVLFTTNSFLEVVPFLILLAYLIYKPLIKAMKTLQPGDIGKSVKSGVISLIVLDSSLTACFAGWEYALIVLLLLPLSRGIAKYFAVT